ncbi:hypothetical protein GEMRC1_002609 [Eukaryota sp. GEM-RC1]
MVFPSLGALCPDKAGFLYKRGKVNTSFKERFFALKLDDAGNHKFFYCKGAAQYNRPVGCIPLRHAAIVPRGCYDNLFHFAIWTFDRIYYVASSSEKTRDSWVYALEKCSELYLECQAADEIQKIAGDRQRSCFEKDPLLKSIFN